MNIIFDRAAAEELGKRYLVLDLETVDINGTPTECFCVVPGDSLTLLINIYEVHNKNK